MNIIYKLDGVDLRDYGVYVSGSKGLISLPKPKEPTSVEWKEYNGNVVDLSKRLYGSRTIELDCFIKADYQLEFISKCNVFFNLFGAAFTRRLNVSIEPLGDNLVLNSESFTSTVNYGDSITVSTNNYSVPEWNTKKAVRKQISGGTSVLKGLSTLLTTPEAGRILSQSFYIKNLGINTLTLTNNLGKSKTVAAGEARLVKWENITANGTSSLQIQFRSDDIGNDLDFAIWRVKLEDGSSCTDWTPAPSELKPLVYEVYQSDNIEVKKEWNQNSMVGTFMLKLTEPEPIKKVIKYTRTSDANKRVSITVTSTKLLNIYWGDGTHTYDVSGTAQTITHDFATDDTFYIVITGNIDEITSLTTTGTIIWTKL